MTGQRWILVTAFLGLFVVGLYPKLEAAIGVSSPPALLSGAPLETGTFPDSWIDGGDCSTEPKFQTHWYNTDLAIIRQSKCETFEAPFLFLLFGDEFVLLMDTGSNSASPVFETVQAAIDQWKAETGTESIKLLVSHTHGHGDHIAGDTQFADNEQVERFVGAGFEDMVDFWGFVDYPNDQRTLDLGGRVIDVLAVPGHHPASVALYDRRTQILFTGDIVYPGHLFVFSEAAWPVFVESIERMVRFARKKPVTWVVGCHIETRAAEFSPYAYGTTFQPDEHTLQLDPNVLSRIYVVAKAMGDIPRCHINDEFVIHPVYLCGITWNGD